jgi:hypothetical protein
MQELVDTSIPDNSMPATHHIEHTPDLITPTYVSDYDAQSPTVGSASQGLAGYSLDELLHDPQLSNNSPELAEGQEMQDLRGKVPLVTQPEANGKVPGNQNWVSMDDNVESPIDPFRVFLIGGPGR